MKKALVTAVWLLCLGSAAAQVTRPPMTEADFRAEADRARTLYQAQNFTGALPLYEDLYARQPANLAFEEALAMCLLAPRKEQSETEVKAAHARSKTLLLDAQSKGDNSPLLKTVLEKMGSGDGYEENTGSKTPAQQDFARAEQAFSGGDLKTALALYQTALVEDPHFYVAALYAGDALFKSGDCAQAGVYYGKAVEIDPDRETAYRYWGDCLGKLGEHQRAEQMYIRAVVAQPYAQTTRSALADWAAANHSRTVAPAVTLPKRVEPDATGQTNLTLDPATVGSPAASAWMAYSIAPTIWAKGLFAKTYPGETVYRHSLAEETQAIQVALAAVKDRNVISKDPTLRLLDAINRDGMLPCFILLDRSDRGIAQDYAAYRKDHRELLAQYIAKYDIHAQ